MFDQLRTGVELLPCSQVPGQKFQGVFFGEEFSPKGRKSL